MDTSNNYIVPVQQYADTEDYFIEIPQEICQELNWQEGDEIDWNIDDKGIIITKVEDTAESREKSRETNITEADEKDWYDFWYESESEGKEFGFH